MTAQQSSFLVRYGNFLFTWRDKIFLVVAIALFLSFRPNTHATWLPLLGISLAVAGQLLRGLVIGYAYIKRGGLNKKVYAENLVTDGFFSICRNPIYVGNIFIIFGLMVIHGNGYVLLIGSIFFLTAYHAIVAAEEAYLLQKFGNAYQEYCADVPRWCFKISRFPEIREHMYFNTKRVIYKDYSTFCSWVGQVLVLLAYRQYGVEDTVSMVWPISIVMVIILATLTRMVKKSGF